MNDDDDDQWDDELAPCGNCYEWEYAPETLNGVVYCMSCGADANDAPPVYGGAGVDLANGPSWTAVVSYQFDDAGRPVVEFIERVEAVS